MNSATLYEELHTRISKLAFLNELEICVLANAKIADSLERMRSA
jgi:hypothetical protein